MAIRPYCRNASPLQCRNASPLQCRNASPLQNSLVPMQSMGMPNQRLCLARVADLIRLNPTF
ncbi:MULTISPECIES: hypothetical protein [Planktothricoides]|uniref:Uncharacterized protein n=2 Tax=Planktothricoides raciborskii TaxID=132608 RepID=A0AAU8J7I4_9CYAN|nr:MULTISPECIES: hypothetical protein [Planktothricoides]MBD2545581.1 hypothetical protein [Planktothricoides raciborskii FACHB-1370]MBD2583487.1 hypothetical protein [Planktothricoides raciborskii FACHB-1261]